MRVVASGILEVLKRLMWLGLAWWPTFIWFWAFVWFTLFFQPLTFSDAVIQEIGNGNFRYTNISKKNWPADNICKFVDSAVVIDSNTQRTIYESDNSPGKGTGSREWTAWPHEGKIPVTATVISVHKIIEYSCLGITKIVRTPERVLSLK